MWTMPPAVLSRAVAAAVDFFLDNFTGSAPGIAFDPVNKGSAAGLSNGNLTYARTIGVLGTGTGVHSATSYTSSGKYYAEFHIDTVDGLNHTPVVGIIGPNAIGGAYPVPGGNAATDGGFGYNSGGTLSRRGSFITSIGGFSAGQIVQVAVDFAAQKLWFGVNNVWVLSGDPAAGTNETFGLNGSTYAVGVGGDGNVANGATARFAASDFTYAPPSGFLPWDAGDGSLYLHNPDVGGAYTSDGGSLTDMVLDGSGNLNSETVGSFARSAAAPAAVPYYIESAFTVSAAGSTDQLWHDVALIDTGSGNWLIEMFLRWHATPAKWTFTTFVVDSSGTTLFVPEIEVAVSIGVEHTIRATVTGSGVIFEIDGTLVSATPQVPDILTDAVEFEANITSGSGGDSSFKVNYIRGVSLAVAPPVPDFFFDDFDGSLGLLTSHTSDSGHTYAYSTKMFFAGFSPKSGDAKVNGSSVVGMDTAGGYCGFVTNYAPTSADYSVEARVHGSFAHAQDCGIAGRYVEASGAGYFVETFPIDATHVAVILEYWDGGVNSATLIGRGGDHVVSDGTDYRVRLEMTGTTIEVFVDDVSIGSVTDAHVTGAGTVGGWLAPSGAGTYDQIAFDWIKAQPL